ncbi:MAG TPA: LUD domain-containing protein [Acidobacteriaceae bacterium]|jgi:L-lactate dehydrogenase complex protein LldG|nr:LUD domain-containing protein [Acidobacteriaceae bacterium]
MSEARAVVLERIVKAKGASGSLSEVEQMWERMPRGYRVAGERDRASVLELFEDRLRDYDATVVRCTAARVAETLRSVLVAAGVRRVGVPERIDLALPEGFEFVTDEGMPAAELNEMDGVLTRCGLAIAETGTLVLQSAAGQGRRALTLVPDVHVCVVRARDVVETVPEAFARLAATATLPTTFVSGPSATADIEMTRIKGVHGPRFLHVVLVEDYG